MADKKITELTAYTAPIDTDLLGGVDITAGATKKFTWAGIKATLKTYFDTLYASGGTPKSIISTAFETKARFSENLSGGTATYGSSGLAINTITTTTNYALVSLFIDPGYLLGAGCVFTATVRFTTIPSSNNPTAFLGIGTPSTSGGALVYTTRHIGFKFRKEAGSYNLYATNADGSTETETLMASGFATGDCVELIAERVGASSVNYYYRKNGAALSAATNITTNIPTTTSGDYAVTVGAGNHGTSAQTEMSIYGMSYQR